MVHNIYNRARDSLSTLTLIYECQTCGTIKKVFDLNPLPELREFTPSENESKESSEQTVPIERETLINV
jgi:hypothetical protein